MIPLPYLMFHCIITSKMTRLAHSFRWVRLRRIFQHIIRKASLFRPLSLPFVFLAFFAYSNMPFKRQTSFLHQFEEYRNGFTENMSKTMNIMRQPFASNIVVSETNKLMYCPIPKAASSNWKYLIRKLDGFPDYEDLSIAHDRNKSSLRYLTDYSPLEVERLLADKQYFKFTFVRNPYMRLLSCYMDKFRNTEGNYTSTKYIPFLADAFSWRYARSIDPFVAPRPSFRSFIDAVFAANPQCMNHHWRPQTLLCGFDFIKYDFVGRMENLSTDARHVLQAIGHPEERFPTHHDINFPPSGASWELAQRLYSSEMMFKVRTLYAKDFKLLQYD